MTDNGKLKRDVRRQARNSGVRYTKALADRRLVDQQMAYYDLRASDYGDPSHPDRPTGGILPSPLTKAAIEAMRPAGDVLELACGPGTATGVLASTATTLTAVDSSPMMLARNRAENAAPNVTFVQADLFDWQPPQSYDFVFFAAFLSHVPETHFVSFWSRLRSWLRDGGSVGFIDEDDRARNRDRVRLVDGTPVATRTLRDGRQFEVVKKFWRPDDLTTRLEGLGWAADVRRLDDAPYLAGVCR
jgi:demethylmenaquinone methyltransferase/2-methoxy-6-polyprenyl-1,4-benzoquinol methylase